MILIIILGALVLLINLLFLYCCLNVAHHADMDKIKQNAKNLK